jgi:hypothetical protein
MADERTQSLAEKAIAILREKERRANDRVPMNLMGRCMLADGREVACRTVNVSTGGIEVTGLVPNAAGEKVICFFDGLGWIDGEVRRITEAGFGMSFGGTPDRRLRMAERVTWLIKHQSDDVADNRRNARIVPTKRGVLVRFAEKDAACTLIDLSRSGVAIESDARPELGLPIVVGMRRGKVVRHLDQGFAVEFALPIPLSSFDEGVVL